LNLAFADPDAAARKLIEQATPSSRCRWRIIANGWL
jgi:hypothetical protein